MLNIRHIRLYKRLTRTGAIAIAVGLVVLGSGGAYAMLHFGADSGLPMLNPGLTRQYWTGISGSTVSSLTSNGNYPNNPTGTDTITANFIATNWNNPSVNQNWADNYGQRLTGYIKAPETGTYYFFIASDDESQLNLSTDSTSAHKTKIASVTAESTTFEQWNFDPTNQKSAAISLVAGQYYYVEAIHKEGTGNDHVEVGWRKPSDGNGSLPTEVVPGSVLYNGSTSTTNLNKGLVGHWKFDGNAKDATPYANDGTVVNASLTADVRGRANSAYSFSGATPGITASITPYKTQSVGTISFWYKPSSTTSSQTLLSDYNADDHQLRITQAGTSFNNVQIQAYYNGSYNNALKTTNAVLTAGTWTNILITCDGSTWTIYINGSAQALTTVAGSNGGQWFNAFSGLATTLHFGYATTGSIDDIYIYNRALNAAEATGFYQRYGAAFKAASGDKGLVGWWRFDSNAKDSTPYSDDGSPTGSPSLTTDREGASSSAYSFNGSSQYVSVPNQNQLNIETLSLSAWIKIASAPASTRSIIEKSASASAYPYALRIGTSGQIIFAAYDGTTTATINTAGSVADNAWHHIVATRTKQGAMAIYVDGASAASGTDTTSGSTTNSSVVAIGADGGGSKYFPGAIDDARIYNRVLSSTEITNLYQSYNSQLSLGGSGQSGSVSLGKGLVGSWLFNNNAKDATPYADNGTVTGATITADRKGRTSSAYGFNGTSNVISVSNQSQLNIETVTLSAWINIGSAPASTRSIIEKSASASTYPYALRIDTSGHIVFAATDGTTTASINTSSSIADGTWHHIVVTRVAQGAMAIYVDGVSAAAGTDTTSGSTTNTSVMGIGADGGGSKFFPGSIDDVRIYNRVLNAAEITALYQQYY